MRVHVRTYVYTYAHTCQHIRTYVVRNDVNTTRFQLLYGHMASSVTTIANNYRMHVARRRRKEMVQLMFQTGTARFLQAAYRGHLGRLAFRALVHANYRRNCTMLIQRSYKCHVARVLFKDLWQQKHEVSLVCPYSGSLLTSVQGLVATEAPRTL